jgi:hypothetical protein
MNMADLRLECLRLAANVSGPHEVVVATASAYVAFVVGPPPEADAEGKQLLGEGAVLSDI